MREETSLYGQFNLIFMSKAETQWLKTWPGDPCLLKIDKFDSKKNKLLSQKRSVRKFQQSWVYPDCKYCKGLQFRLYKNVSFRKNKIIFHQKWHFAPENIIYKISKTVRSKAEDLKRMKADDPRWKQTIFWTKADDLLEKSDDPGKSRRSRGLLS